jgi:hypothetical protein
LNTDASSRRISSRNANARALGVSASFEASSWLSLGEVGERRVAVRAVQVRVRAELVPERLRRAGDLAKARHERAVPKHEAHALHDTKHAARVRGARRAGGQAVRPRQ